MNMFVSSEDLVAAIPLNSEKETLVPVRTKETVSEKNQLPFFRRDGGSVFCGDFLPNQRKA